MMRHSEKVEDDVRDRVQTAKDEVWDEFTEQIRDVRKEMEQMRQDASDKDEKLEQLRNEVRELSHEKELMRQEIEQLKIKEEEAVDDDDDQDKVNDEDKPAG